MSSLSSVVRRSVLLGAIIAAVVVLAACGSSSSSSSSSAGSTSLSADHPVTVVVGVPRNFGYLSTLWARNVQPKGVHVEYKYFPDFTEMLTALNAGQIDLTEIGDVGAVQSYVNGGGKVQAIAVSQPNSLNCGLLVPKGSPAKTFADLKGKSVLFLKSTNSYIAFLHQTQAAGLKQSDFNIVQIAGPPANKAFQAGQVAAYYTIDPNLADIVAQTGAREISTCAQAGVQNLYPYVATTAAIKTKSAALGAIVRALADNFAWIKAHPEQQAQLLAPKLGFSEAAIKTTFARGAHGLETINPAFYSSEQKVINQLVAAKIVPSPVQAQKVFLSTYNADTTAQPNAGQ